MGGGDAGGDDLLRVQTQLITEIQHATDTLGTSVAVLAGTQSVQIVKLRRAVRWVAAGLALDLALTVLGAFLVVKSYQNSDAIAAGQAALKARQARSGPALCSLYDVFLDSYNPASAAARANPASYEDAFRQLEAGAMVFGCAHTTKGRN